MNILDLKTAWIELWPYLTLAVTVASVLNTLPQPAPGSHWTPVRKIISFVALGVGHAMPANAPELGPWLLRLAAKYLAANGLVIKDGAAVQQLVLALTDAQTKLAAVPPAPVAEPAPANLAIAQDGVGVVS
jgi:hypothetical protein